MLSLPSPLRAWPGLILLTGLALIGWCASCRSPHPPPASTRSPGMLPSQAQVVEVRGFGARAKNPRASWKRAQLGDWLAMGATVQTTPDSSLTPELLT